VLYTTETRVDTPDSIGEITGICESAWGMNPCPNQAAWIVKSLVSSHFAIMCDEHAEGNKALHPTAKFDYLPFTMELAEELNDAVKQEMREIEEGRRKAISLQDAYR